MLPVVVELGVDGCLDGSLVLVPDLAVTNFPSLSGLVMLISWRDSNLVMLESMRSR